MRKPSPDVLRGLPSVSQVDRFLEQQGLPSGKVVRSRVQALLGQFRAQLRQGQAAEPGPATAEAPGLREQVLHAIAAAVSQPAQRQLQRVINATGVVAHTNLGRAPLALATLQAVAPLLAAYCNLEFDLESGQRGERGGRVLELLVQLSGAEA
ncbi:MAG TPA: L-seryl-tRNA(Sec) selenium transferase, partial [bacterium]|nr:L-seryl-tRNA(Sec) selenium transferase [bacterium]